MKEKITNEESDEQSPPRFQQVYAFVRQNWLPFFFALCITLLTIIVVPIIYSIDKRKDDGPKKKLQWNSTAHTLIQNNNQSSGMISAIKFDSDNNLFLLDRTMHQLRKWDSLSNQTTLIYGNANGAQGNDSQSLNAPTDFLFTSAEEIYIVDSGNDRILSLPDQLARTSTVICPSGQRFSSLFSAMCLSSDQSNRLNKPMSLTMDGNSKLYIANYATDQILICDLQTNTLQLFQPSDGSGDRNTYVKTPISIRYDHRDASLVIGQQSGFNVVRWQLDSPTWTLVAGSANSNLNGTSRTLFRGICALEINPLGNTFVVDCPNERIQFYEMDKAKGRTIAGVIQANGSNPYLFKHPTAITFDEENNLYVADANNFRIQTFPVLL